MVCAARGYKCAVMPETMSRERKLLLKACTRRPHPDPAPRAMPGAVPKAEELAAADARYFIPQRFEPRQPDRPPQPPPPGDLGRHHDGGGYLRPASAPAARSPASAGPSRRRNRASGVIAVRTPPQPGAVRRQPQPHRSRASAPASCRSPQYRHATTGSSGCPTGRPRDGPPAGSRGACWSASRQAPPIAAPCKDRTSARRMPGKLIVVIIPSFGERYLSWRCFQHRKSDLNRFQFSTGPSIAGGTASSGAARRNHMSVLIPCHVGGRHGFARRRCSSDPAWPCRHGCSATPTCHSPGRPVQAGIALRPRLANPSPTGWCGCRASSAASTWRCGRSASPATACSSPPPPSSAPEQLQAAPAHRALCQKHDGRRWGWDWPATEAALPTARLFILCNPTVRSAGRSAGTVSPIASSPSARLHHHDQDPLRPGARPIPRTHRRVGVRRHHHPDGAVETVSIRPSAPFAIIPDARLQAKRAMAGVVPRQCSGLLGAESCRTWRRGAGRPAQQRGPRRPGDQQPARPRHHAGQTTHTAWIDCRSRARRTGHPQRRGVQDRRRRSLGWQDFPACRVSLRLNFGCPPHMPQKPSNESTTRSRRQAKLRGTLLRQRHAPCFHPAAPPRLLLLPPRPEPVKPRCWPPAAAGHHPTPALDASVAFARPTWTFPTRNGADPGRPRQRLRQPADGLSTDGYVRPLAPRRLVSRDANAGQPAEPSSTTPFVRDSSGPASKIVLRVSFNDPPYRAATSRTPASFASA